MPFLIIFHKRICSISGCDSTTLGPLRQNGQQIYCVKVAEAEAITAAAAIAVAVAVAVAVLTCRCGRGPGGCRLYPLHTARTRCTLQHTGVSRLCDRLKDNFNDIAGRDRKLKTSERTTGYGRL